MGSEQWTPNDAQQWRSLGPSAWATALVVVLLIGSNVVLFQVLYKSSDSDLPDWSDFTWISWNAIVLTSAVLIRHAPGIAFGFAAAVALYDAQIFWLSSHPAPVALVVASCPAASALHAKYLHVAWDRQRQYAAARAQTPVELAHLAPVAAPLRPGRVIGSTVGAWGALMLFAFLPVALGSLQGADDSWATARAAALVALLLLIPVALVVWQDESRESKAVAWLSSGTHRGLPVELVINPRRKVELRVPGEKESFAGFRARKGPNQEPPAVPLETPMLGTLFGDLRRRGWAAVVSGGILVLPEDTLTMNADEIDPPQSP